MRNKVKRTLSFLLTFVMLCSLLPVTAMAKEGDVTASKKAEYNKETGEVTITMTVQGDPVTQSTASKADVVLVVDNSGSMASSVGEPCKTPKENFEKAGWGWLECPNCGSRYYQGVSGWLVPDICEGEKGTEPRIDTAKKVGKTFANSILSEENDNQMAVIGFAHTQRDWFESVDAIRQRQDLTKDGAAVENTLNAMNADGGTDYTSALQEAYNMLNGRGETDRPGYVVFISDGAPGLQGSSIGNSDWDGSEQAKAIKAAGYQLYTIGIALDNEADDYLESLASDNHYQNVTGANYASELEELLKKWAGEINTVPAGTEANLVDTISDKFTLKENQDDHNRSLTFDYENNKVTWNVGEITEEGKEISFVVIPNEGVHGENIPTNKEAALTYKDAEGNPQSLGVANATVNIPAPTVETVALNYNANGGIGGPASVQVEKGKTAQLDSTNKPSHKPEGGKEVEFRGWSAEQTDGIFESADKVPEGTVITEIAVGETDVTVYAVWAFGGPVDPTTPEEKLPVFLYVLNQTNGDTTTTDKPEDYSYLATGAKVKAGTKMDGTVYKGTDALNQIANWNVGALGAHDGYAAVSSAPVGTGSEWTMDESGNVTEFIFKIGNNTYTNENYDFTWQKLSYIGASYKVNANDEELQPAFHLDGVLTEKDPVDPPEPPTWDHSKNKEATPLDSNYNSTVTLSLPSAQEELVSDVVFVLDKSTSNTVETQALDMLKDLQKKAEEDGATVKVGVVIFNKETHVTEWKDLVTEYDDIEAAITQKISSGTNTHAGLLAAQKMLVADTDVEDSRKHVIFVSDGITYMFDEPAQAINSQQATNGENQIMAGPDCWSIRHYLEGGDQFIPSNWNTYLQDVENHYSAVEEYIQPYEGMDKNNHIPKGNTVLPTTVDVALYKTAKLYHELSEKYHCYAVLGNTSVQDHPWGHAFMTYLADGKEVSFDDIQNDIYYLLAKGSQVVDIIGQGKDNKGNDYNFDVVNLKNMTITVGKDENKVTLNKEEIKSAELPEGSIAYGFFKGATADGRYDFVVTYYPEGVADADGETREHFVWDINVSVSNFAPVQFSYDVHLTNPQTTKGTYKVETNVEATLTPVDSNEESGKPEKFPVPELEYTVGGGSGGDDYRYVNVTVVGKGDVDYKCGDDKGTITEQDGTELLTLDLYEEFMKFNMEPASGWKLDRIEVNGQDVGKDLEYKMIFDEVTGNQMDIDVKIVFKEKSGGGSGGGGSHKPNNKPDKTPDALNGKDHFDYVVGYSDGLVHPERNITRAEVASIFFRLLQDDIREKNLTDQNPFNDVFTDDWFNVAVSTMYDMDIVYGRDNNSFDPNAYITRAEFAAIAARFDSEGYSGENLFSDIDGHWAANQINRAAEKGWISGYPDGTFGPNRYITRAEAVTLINRVLNRLPESVDALHKDMNVFPDNMDTSAWYYLAIQEATSSHEYEKDKDDVYETWTDVLPDRDWAKYLKLN
ncbi:S-layer homology domain-containing protein [Anaerotignum sp.]|uniref:S-layer homology domain-containing protein n=1 Tax=Anaerotignum sp. TaxID=2039241 RepID=UPI003736F495